MSTTIESLEVEIQSSSTSAADGINALSSSLEKLKNAVKGGSGLTSLHNQLAKLDSVLKGVSEGSAEKMGKLAGGLSALSNSKISSSIATQLGRINEAMGNMPDSGIKKLERVSDAVEKLKGLGNVNLSNVSSSLGNISSAPILDSSSVTSGAGTVSDATDEITRCTDEVSRASEKTGRWRDTLSQAGAKLKDVVRNPVLTGLSKLSNYLKSLGRATSVSNSKLGQFIDSLKRIAMYRAIRFFLSTLTAAMREGITNIYQYSKIFDGTFSQSLDRCATSFQYLKNSMAAMVSPIINALAPAVDFVIDKFVALLNIVNQLFARLSGSSTYTAAKKQVTAYAAATSDAGAAATKAAKEIRDATLGIDELNVISPNIDTDYGSGSGGSSTPDYGSMFEQLPISQNISDFTDKLKTAFETGNWKELGTLLGEKINGMVDGIDWKGIGSKVGYYLNGAIQTAYWFLKTVNFTNIGAQIASMINAALSAIDGEFIGRLIIRWFTKGFDFWIGFLITLDWGLVAKTLSDGIKGLFNEAADWFDSIDWPKLNKEVGKKLIDFFSNIDWKGIASSVGRLFTSVFKDGFNPLGIIFLGILAKPLLKGIGGLVSFIGGKIGGILSVFGKSGSGAIAEFKIPSVKTVLKGLADLALIVLGVIGIIEVVGLLMLIPGFEDTAKSGITALGIVFGGLLEIIVPLTLMSAGIVALGKIGVATVAKGLVSMAIVVGGVTAVITAVGALISIPYFSDFLATGIESVKDVFNGLWEVALPIGIFSALLIGLGLATPAVILSGLAGFALVIGGLALVLVALGALNQIPGFSWIVGEGGKVLMQLGEILGGFVGSIVSGLLNQISSSFPKIGKNLAGFMTNAKPFFEGLDKIDASSVKAVKRLAETVLILTAASVLDGLTSWFTGGNSFVDFGEQLCEFAPYLKKYCSEIKGIDGDAVEASANAALSLAKFAKEIPKMGGIFSWFAGDNDLALFGKNLKSFGKDFAAYYKEIKDIDSGVVTSSADAALALAKFAKEIPKMGGIFSWFAGDNDLTSFGKGLRSFGKDFADYYQSIKKIKPDAIESTTSAAESLASFAKQIPKMSGVASWFSGENDMVVFGRGLVLFGKDFKTYYDHVKDIKSGVVTTSADAAQSVVELAKMVPKKGGAISILTGDNKLSDFGAEVAKFGEKFGVYYSHISGVDGSKVSSVSTQMKRIIEWASSISSADTKTMSEFSKVLANMGKDFSSLANDIVEGFSSKISSAYSQSKGSITSWGTSIHTWFTNSSNGGVNKEKFSTYGQDIINGFKDKVSSTHSTSQSSVTTWAKKVHEWFSNSSQGDVNKEKFATYATDVINGFKDKITSTYNTSQNGMTTWAKKVLEWFTSKSYGDVNKEKFATYATDIINGFKDKIASSYTSAKKSMTTWGEDVKKWFTANASYDVFYQLGKDVVNGFDGGLAKMLDASVNSVKKWSTSLVDAMKDKLGIESPSKVFGEMAGFSVSGYNNEIIRKGASTQNVINDWVKSFTNVAPRMALAVDTSALKYYDSNSFVKTVSASVTSNSNITAVGFKDAMEEFYKDYVEPTITRMADDVRRQADKDEHTTVQIGNRVITDAVTTQQKANGYQFVTT